jgi:DDE superfamily endonuclease
MQESGIDEENIIFQQDNDSKHKSHKAQKWMDDQGIVLLDWPAQSPDLNLIEHLWDHIKKQLRKYPTPPTGVWNL